MELSKEKLIEQAHQKFETSLSGALEVISQLQGFAEASEAQNDWLAMQVDAAIAAQQEAEAAAEQAQKQNQTLQECALAAAAAEAAAPAVSARATARIEQPTPSQVHRVVL